MADLFGGLPGDVYFGDARRPLPDWRREHSVSEEHSSHDDDEPSPVERRGVIGMLGFDPREFDEEEPGRERNEGRSLYAKRDGVSSRLLASPGRRVLYCKGDVACAPCAAKAEQDASSSSYDSIDMPIVPGEGIESDEGLAPRRFKLTRGKSGTIRVTYARSTPVVRNASGQTVSARSKSQSPACSQAASAWRTGSASKETYTVLAHCRAMAATKHAAKLHAVAGNTAKAAHLEKVANSAFVTKKSRLAQAAELHARRYAGAGSAQAPAPAPAPAPAAAPAPASEAAPAPVNTNAPSPAASPAVGKPAASGAAPVAKPPVPRPSVAERRSRVLGKIEATREASNKATDSASPARKQAFRNIARDTQAGYLAKAVEEGRPGYFSKLKEKRERAASNGGGSSAATPPVSPSAPAPTPAQAPPAPAPKPSPSPSLKDQASAHRSAKGLDPAQRSALASEKRSDREMDLPHTSGVGLKTGNNYPRFPLKGTPGPQKPADRESALSLASQRQGMIDATKAAPSSVAAFDKRTGDEKTKATADRASVAQKALAAGGPLKDQMRAAVAQATGRSDLASKASPAPAPTPTPAATPAPTKPETGSPKPGVGPSTPQSRVAGIKSRQAAFAHAHAKGIHRKETEDMREEARRWPTIDNASRADSKTREANAKRGETAKQLRDIRSRFHATPQAQAAIAAQEQRADQRGRSKLPLFGGQTPEERPHDVPSQGGASATAPAATSPHTTPPSSRSTPERQSRLDQIRAAKKQLESRGKFKTPTGETFKVGNAESGYHAEHYTPESVRSRASKGFGEDLDAAQHATVRAAFRKGGTKVVGREQAAAEAESAKRFAGSAAVSQRMAEANRRGSVATATAGRRHANAADLAADYKARGIEPTAAYSRFVKDRDLQPELDAKEFNKAYSTVTPKRYEENAGAAQSAAATSPRTSPVPGLPKAPHEMTNHELQHHYDSDPGFAKAWDSRYAGSPVNPLYHRLYLQEAQHHGAKVPESLLGGEQGSAATLAPAPHSLTPQRRNQLGIIKGDIRQGEQRLESKRNGIGEKLSKGELGAVAKSVEGSKKKLTLGGGLPSRDPERAKRASELVASRVNALKAGKSPAAPPEQSPAKPEAPAAARPSPSLKEAAAAHRTSKGGSPALRADLASQVRDHRNRQRVRGKGRNKQAIATIERHLTTNTRIGDVHGQDEKKALSAQARAMKRATEARKASPKPPEAKARPAAPAESGPKANIPASSPSPESPSSSTHAKMQGALNSIYRGEPDDRGLMIGQVARKAGVDESSAANYVHGLVSKGIGSYDYYSDSDAEHNAKYGTVHRDPRNNKPISAFRIEKHKRMNEMG